MLTELFSKSEFMPHVHCYLNHPGLVWTMFATDLSIGISYFVVSTILLIFVKRIKLQFNLMFLLFGVFILACGVGHLMETVGLWYPYYYVQAGINLITAIASIGTAIYLYRLRYSIVSVARDASKSEERRLLLEQTNLDLNVRSQELAAMNEALEEQQKILAHSAKMSALGEMAGGIAHEINSPLGIITIHANQLERLQRRGTLTPQLLEERAQLIAATAKRIGDIIKGLRAFAREGERDPFLFTSLSSIIQDALVLCESRFKNFNTTLEVTRIPAGLELECRSVQISQVILNILNNSFDAVQELPEKWVKLDISETRDLLTLSFTDSGTGIPIETQSKLFQPFFTTKEVGKGTGLGLSISKGIVNAHHGSLEYDPSSQHTRFIVTLPKRQNKDGII